MRSWRVRKALPLNLKTLRARVREHGIGSLEIHKRGLPVSPDTVRAAVRPTGEAHETWVMTRLGPREDRTRGVVVVVEPCPEEPPAEDPAPAS